MTDFSRIDFSTDRIKARLAGISKPEMLDMNEAEIKECAAKFERFAANWNIKPTGPALKMFLACAFDTAMHRIDCNEIPDGEWEAFCRKVILAFAEIGER